MYPEDSIDQDEYSDVNPYGPRGDGAGDNPEGVNQSPVASAQHATAPPTENPTGLNQQGIEGHFVAQPNQPHSGYDPYGSPPPPGGTQTGQHPSHDMYKTGGPPPQDGAFDHVYQGMYDQMAAAAAASQTSQQPPIQQPELYGQPGVDPMVTGHHGNPTEADLQYQPGVGPQDYQQHPGAQYHGGSPAGSAPYNPAYSQGAPVVQQGYGTSTMGPPVDTGPQGYVQPGYGDEFYGDAGSNRAADPRDRRRLVAVSGGLLFAVLIIAGLIWFFSKGNEGSIQPQQDAQSSDSTVTEGVSADPAAKSVSLVVATGACEQTKCTVSGPMDSNGGAAYKVVVEDVDPKKVTVKIDAVPLEDPTSAFGFTDKPGRHTITVEVEGSEEPIVFNQYAFSNVAGYGVLLESVARSSDGFDTALASFDEKVADHPQLILTEGVYFKEFSDSQYILYVGGFATEEEAKTYCNERKIIDSCEVKLFESASSGS